MAFGAICSWLMECYENGALTKADLDGLDMSWGNYNSVLLLLEKTAFRRGVGNIIAEGEYRACQHFGERTEPYALTIKKAEFEGCDPRGYKGRGVAFGTSARGADNCRALSAIESAMTPEFAKENFGDEDAARMTGWRGKGKLVKYLEDLPGISELLGLCRYGPFVFVTGIPRLLARSEMCARGWAALTGMVEPDKALDYLVTCMERVLNLERLFIVREGARRKDDLLPQRFRTVPMPEGPAKGSVVENEKILNEYYQARGWDVETGIPLPETVERLGLVEYAKNMREYAGCWRSR